MFAKRIVNLRKQKELTQEELAVALGISRSALSLYEIGKREPDTETMLKIATFFNVSTDYLLGLSNENNTNVQRAEIVQENPDNFLYYWISKTGLGYDEVAKKLNISEDLLENYCTGMDMPLSILVELSKICSVSTDCLLGLRESSRPEQDGVMPFRFDPEISRRLKDQARQMDESYGFIADMLGIEESEVFNFFEYGFVPHLEVFVKIVEHFVVSSDYLLNRTNSTLVLRDGEDKMLRLYRSFTPEYKDIANGELTKLKKQQEFEEYQKQSSVAADEKEYLKTGTDNLGK